MPGLFADGDVIRRVDGEAVLLVGGGRALLMQLAHPAVAAGVAEHSDFEADPFLRLRRTLAVMTTVVFGAEDDARRAVAALAAVHESVRGPGYAADDPDLMLWVHATLVDTALRVHRRYLGGLSPEDEERYYGQSARLGEVLGIPLDRQPADHAAFRAYVRHMVGTLAVSDVARRLATGVLHPRVRLAVEPLAELARQLTVGLLPSPLRRQYGLAWGPHQQAALLVTEATARRMLPLVPSFLRRAAS